MASRRDLAVDDFREYEGAAGDHRVVELAVGDLRAVKCAAASFMQAKALPETLMLSNVLLATLVQSTVRSRAGPLCCPHCLPLGGLTDDRDEGVVDVSESGVADLLADERAACEVHRSGLVKGPPEWPREVHRSGLEKGSKVHTKLPAIFV